MKRKKYEKERKLKKQTKSIMNKTIEKPEVKLGLKEDLTNRERDIKRRLGKGDSVSKKEIIKKTFKVSSLAGISERLKDKELVGILKYLGKRDYQVKRDILNKEFSSEEELYDFLKEDLINFLRNEHETLKEKISQIRKKGKDVDYEWLKLRIIPSKINIFKSSLVRKDFDKVINLIDNLENSLKEYDEISGEKKVVKKEKIDVKSKGIVKLSIGKNKGFDKKKVGEKRALKSDDLRLKGK